MTAFFARGGIQSLVTEPGGPPAAFRPGQGDHTSSLSILSAVLAALRLRDQTGEGQTVAVALMHVAAWTISSDLSATLVTGANPELHHRASWPSPLTCRFRCSDDRWVALCMPGPKDFFAAFADCLGHPEWVTDERFANPESRRRNATVIVAACDEVFASQPRAWWADRLDDAGLTWAPVPGVGSAGRRARLAPPVRRPPQRTVPHRERPVHARWRRRRGARPRTTYRRPRSSGAGRSGLRRRSDRAAHRRWHRHRPGSGRLIGADQAELGCPGRNPQTSDRLRPQSLRWPLA